jgi:hypothetical protein
MKNGFDKFFAVVRDHLGLDVSKIGTRMTKKIYIKGASVRNCDGSCCSFGSTASVVERNTILKHSKIVQAEMTSRGRNDTSRWFTTRIMKDEDFTAGKTVYTRIVDGACVFLRDDGLCALQVAGEKNLKTPYALKPAICLLWPVSVRDHEIVPGYSDFTHRRECCSPVRNGDRTLVQVMVPDRKLVAQMSRPGHSKGGGPAKRRRA